MTAPRRLASIPTTPGVTSVEGLYRLHLNSTTQYAARNLTIESEDLELTLEEDQVGCA